MTRAGLPDRQLRISSQLSKKKSKPSNSNKQQLTTSRGWRFSDASANATASLVNSFDKDKERPLPKPPCVTQRMRANGTRGPRTESAYQPNLFGHRTQQSFWGGGKMDGVGTTLAAKQLGGPYLKAALSSWARVEIDPR
mmetsp:Transcript_30769/g.117773  ORF Transcript_30769/g.117773 Transcript_30769/m.117773 type:complete len:139 (-) Transcript_30769:588-1004(-)